MFGITDPAIWVGYLLALAFALACVVYGLLNWNGETGEERDGS
ncbi:symporter small accessory protein [Methanoculleus sp.]